MPQVFNKFLGLTCMCHLILDFHCFFVSAVLVEVSSWNFEPGNDEISMVQTSVHSHRTITGQQPVIQNDLGPPTDKFGRVPVYGSDRVHHNDVDSWMLMFPKNYTRKMLLEICSALSSQDMCKYVGHPEDGGMAYLSIQSVENELRSRISSSCATQQASSPVGLCGARYAEVDGPLHIDPEFPVQGGSSDRNAVPWGLDRIDRRERELDGKYETFFTGKGIHVFLLDTGINCELDEFSDRCHYAFDATRKEIKECLKDDIECGRDNNGHGTHCAGTIASPSYGVAKEASLHAVKVLDDSGSGGWAGFIDGIDWVISHCTQEKFSRAVISASLGGIGPTNAISEAIRKATDNGISVVVAAGNAAGDACNTLPASVKAAITVGSTDFVDNLDIKSDFSNYGPCIDIFAPGSNITSLSHKKGEPPVIMSGTSMACPHVAGVVALIFQEHPLLTGTTVHKELNKMASRGCVKNLFPRGSTPNKLLYFGRSDDVRPCQRNPREFTEMEEE